MEKSRIFVGKEGISSEIIHCGSEACAPGHEFGGLRAYNLLHIIRSGEGDFYCRDRRWHLEKGDAFFIFPGVQNLYRADPENPWSYFWLAFTGDFQPLFESIDLNPDYPVLRTEDVEPLYAKYCAIKDKSNSAHPEAILEVSANLRLILSSLFRDRALTEVNAQPSENIQSFHVGTMINFIDSHFSAPINVEDVTSYVSLERTYASRLFKNQTGESIGRYLKRIRLEQAALFLRQGWSVKETAYSVGFRDYENFLRNFKKYKGMTPGNYRSRESGGG